jgi:hypothetical protein
MWVSLRRRSPRLDAAGSSDAAWTELPLQGEAVRADPAPGETDAAGADGASRRGGVAPRDGRPDDRSEDTRSRPA